ncbi:YihY/virulence factor BrkB family protein [Phenylobacterium immobile]|uniref:YihY/virulence factor BrkB family protein n=1 Tax=Phenylobacterium immobile TaxID=21 RepID=UPI000A654074|nr:YihY/virulence factor BrkB family protein [Phenylobacterium immobile]
MPRPKSSNLQNAPLRASRFTAGSVARGVASVAPWLGLAVVGALWLRGPRPLVVQEDVQPGLSKPVVASPEHFETAEPGRGRLAAQPHHIPWLGWRDIAWRTWREIGADRLPAVAGGVTFYLLLAIFPGVGAFVSLYGLFADVGAVSQQLDQLAVFAPREVLSLVGDQMGRLVAEKQSNLSFAFAVSLLLSLWSANAGMNALFDGLNVAYDEEERRNFFYRRVLTLGFTFGALLFLSVVTAILVAAPLAAGFVGLGESIQWLIPVRWLVLLLVAGLGFAFVYRYGPSRARAQWRWVIWGSVFASVAWIGGSLGFSWYVNNIAHYDATYGSLGAVIGFMMWIWFSVMVVLLGAELNAEIEHQTALDSTSGAPKPMGERGAAMADTVGLAFAGVRKMFGVLRGDLGRQGRSLLRRKPQPLPKSEG